MIGLVVRLTILFGVVFGVVYGLVRSAKRKRDREIAAEKALVLDRLRALVAAKERGELTESQADELTWQVYLESKDKGIDLAREDVSLPGETPDIHAAKAQERKLEPQD